MGGQFGALVDGATLAIEASLAVVTAVAVAGRLAHDHAPADLIVLHVNLYQNRDNTRTEELTQAISSTLDGVEASVVTRRGFLVEEVIPTEATQTDADYVVVGSNQKTSWRKLLSRLLQNDPAVSSYLHKNSADEVEIIGVDAADKTISVKAV
jgi:K+-sensing histidine kinase KdpD